MPEALFVNLGNRVKEVRLNRKLTLDKLSEISKISIRHISKIEHGTMNPSYDVLNRLASALGVSPGYFFLAPNSIDENDIELLTSLYEGCPREYRALIMATVQALSKQIQEISTHKD